MSHTDQDYYRRRAAEEQSAAEHAATDGVAAVHRQLAKRYLDMAGEPHLVDASTPVPVGSSS